MANNTHTILFNAASTTILGLTEDQRQAVLDEIDCIMNGDGLYEGASQEIILEAYHNQEAFGRTWVDLIRELI